MKSDRALALEDIDRATARERLLIAARAGADEAMATPDKLAALADSVDLLSQLGVAHALIGGVAVGIHTGAPRATLDIDQTLRKVMQVLRSLFPEATPCVLTYHPAERMLEFTLASLEFYPIDNPEYQDIKRIPIDGPSIARALVRSALANNTVPVINVGDVENEDGWQEEARQRDQEAAEQLPSRTRVLQRIAQHPRVRPQAPPHRGARPESVERERQQRQSRILQCEAQHVQEFAAVRERLCGRGLGRHAIPRRSI